VSSYRTSRARYYLCFSIVCSTHSLGENAKGADNSGLSGIVRANDYVESSEVNSKILEGFEALEFNPRETIYVFRHALYLPIKYV